VGVCTKLSPSLRSNEPTSKMVKVWYTPPPYGPRTSLNRPAYGIGGDAHNPAWVTKIAKMPRTQVIAGFTLFFSCLAYIPLCKLVDHNNNNNSRKEVRHGRPDG